MAVGMSNAYPQPNLTGQGRSDVRACERIRISVVDALPVGVELIAEKIVVEAAERAGHGRIAIGRAEIPSIGAEAQFGDGSAAGSRPDLHHTGHGVGSVERALHAA